VSRAQRDVDGGDRLNLEAQAILPSAEVRDECQESQHQGDGKKQRREPTEEPKPSEGHHRWNRGTQPAALHVAGQCEGEMYAAEA
jgi:hypothetical protein